ncbi:5-oxoprolinase subunit PxpB [Evansella sp. AB-P1]|uniref:5-oxoprolinase subunit PxpB n=1 Tax=Evansella sp. AB-P1 TaxID=3037653 RepID=UPI00241BE629|nr:5-oxoprolinase subunit PxpB [Evansella sp. AB-P1]MDG5787447.1 5-oxoprolinase subunit PxpB [Evansella sp. AB-P1]
MSSFTVMPLGDKGIRIDLGNVISPAINSYVHQLGELVEKRSIAGIEEVVPAYSTLTIYYNPIIISYESLKLQLTELGSKLSPSAKWKRRKIILPVFYGGILGPDLEYIARYHSLSIDDVIQIHAKPVYLTYMIGFSPGFPYLGGLDKRLATPRRSNPRKKVLAGSVGIAGSQTGVYSIDSPGGWQIIGRTPVPLFRPNDKEPTLFQAGDYLQFQSITKEEYESIADECLRGVYKTVIQL